MYKSRRSQGRVDGVTSGLFGSKVIGQAEMNKLLKNDKSRRIVVSVWFVLLLCVPMTALTQTPLPVSPHRDLSITRLNDEQALFSDILQGASSRLLRANTVVIRNNDQRKIIGMVGIWKITDSSGRISTSILSSDIFFSLRPNTVLPSGQSILLAPSGWINPETYRKIRAMGQDPEAMGRAPVVASRLAQVSAVKVSVDSVIFEDGELCGENTMHLDQEIHARKRAALYISSLVRTSMARGEDWRAALEPYKAVTEEFKPYEEAFWKQRFASDLLEEEDPLGRIAFYEKLPSPPSFHACAEKK